MKTATRRPTRKSAVVNRTTRRIVHNSVKAKPGNDKRIEFAVPRGDATQVLNQVLVNESMVRTQWMQSMIDPRRDMNKECGYPEFISPSMYREMYDRMGVATRVNNIFPDECWAVDPQVYEVDEEVNTPFEEAWLDLINSPDTNPLHYLYRLDILSGIGRYGCMLIGLDDNKEMNQPVDGIDDFGQMVPSKNKKERKVTFFRVFDEMQCDVASYETNPRNPRFGLPKFYNIRFADVTTNGAYFSGGSKKGYDRQVEITRAVHWTRIIHAADNRESSEVLGIPRAQPVFNHLCDVRKILGGSAEMFWKGGFPGLSFELNPEIMQAAGIELDTDSLKDQFWRYSNGLQRYLALVGMSAKSLAPQIANPVGNLDIQIQAIAVALGVPQRIFTGSEQAQLASGQDVRTWNRRLAKRQERYLTPCMVRPLVNRLIATGVLPPPTQKAKGLIPYKVYWPDINMPTKDDQSKIGDRISAAMTKYILCQGDQLIPPYQWLTMCIGFTDDEAKAIIKSANGKKSLTITPPPTGSGFAQRTSEQSQEHTSSSQQN